MRHSLIILLGLALASGAPAQSSLPNAPTPAAITARAAASPVPQQSGTFPESPPAPTPQPASAEYTMFPHSVRTPYWISGQLNVITQGHAGFHSPYQGPNSFRSAPEEATSVLDTLFLAWQPHRSLRYNTDFIVDFEEAGGAGLSQALGLAGFTNLDVVRNPELSKAPYLARGEIHQTFGLTDRMTEVDRGPLGLPAEAPVRRFEVRVGKMSLPDVFDLNEVASDSHLQFMNWTIDNNGAWDYAADTRGYTVGGEIEYDDRAWTARYGIFAMPTVANGINLDWAFSRARGQNWEFDWFHSVLPGRRGAIRILGYVNNAHMGNYRQAVRGYFAHATPTPEITAYEHFGAAKYGFGWNSEQEITSNFRVATRFGWNDDQEESFAYTEVGQTVLIAGDYYGTRWHRPADKFGVAFNSNAIKKDHQNYLKYGGLGFLLGDGRLNYGRENIVEGYYNWHFWKGLYCALDLQHIADPGYNRDRGPVLVESIREHIDF